MWSFLDFSFRSHGFEKSEIECWFEKKDDQQEYAEEIFEEIYLDFCKIDAYFRDKFWDKIELIQNVWCNFQKKN